VTHPLRGGDTSAVAAAPRLVRRGVIFKRPTGDLAMQLFGLRVGFVRISGSVTPSFFRIAEYIGWHGAIVIPRHIGRDKHHSWPSLPFAHIVILEAELGIERVVRYLSRKPKPPRVIMYSDVIPQLPIPTSSKGCVLNVCTGQHDLPLGEYLFAQHIIDCAKQIEPS